MSLGGVLRGLVAAAALLAVVRAAAPAAAGPPIKIGAFLAVTGPASYIGDPEAKTLRMMADQVNKAGGVVGRPLEVVIYDSAGDARQAVTFARRLIEEDKVDILIGGSTTGETMAAVPMIEEAQIPFISLAGATVVVEPVKKWVFQMPHSDRMAVEKIYGDMKRNDRTKAAILGGSGGLDQSCRKEAVALAPKYGITIVADETYAPSDTDMTAQLTRIKNATGVQGIVGCGFGAAAAITARNYRQLGMQGIQFYLNHGVGSRQFIDGAGGGAEGMRIAVAAVLVADQLNDKDPQKPVALAYIKAYRSAYNEAISTFGGHAYDGFMIAITAMARAGAADKAKVRDEIESTKAYIGVDGMYNLSPQDHMGLGPDSFKLAEIRKNTWTLLY